MSELTEQDYERATWIKNRMEECFPDPPKPGDVADLIKRLFVKQLAGDSFDAGWVAAEKKHGVGDIRPRGWEEPVSG